MPQIEDVASFLPQFFWLLITFISLFLIIWKISLPAFSHTLSAPHQRIHSNLANSSPSMKEA